MKGGIKKNSDTYFINALPYFEIPQGYDLDKAKIFFNLNGKIFEDYKTMFVDRRLVLDINDMPIVSSETAYVDICVECDTLTSPSYSFRVCGQTINYDHNSTYKFDRFGILCNNGGDNYSYYGNHIKNDCKSKNVEGLFPIENLEDFKSIPDGLYFTNLLAACCYASESSEISHGKFRKCISYAATRLNIDIQREGFISNAKKLLSNAGILQFDYSNGKCQAVAPSFMRIPFSKHQAEGYQLIMLSGCYTRSFISNLHDYCKSHGINMFFIKNETHKNEEKLLPPVILFGHNFNPADFCKEYEHQCDILLDHDFALSLLNIVPSCKEVGFSFEYSNSLQSLLDPRKSSSTDVFPRTRSMRGSGGKKYWYIEGPNNKFAEVRQGYVPWASIYCHYEQDAPMVIQKNNSVFLPATLILPEYVQRSLYLMNLGLPQIKNVFVCGRPGKSYYSQMVQYNLRDSGRCETFASKIAGEAIGESVKHVRKSIDTKCKMEFWKLPFSGRRHREAYLVLKDYKDEILAIAHDGNVYLSCQGNFKRIIADTINEAMTFLITEKWQFLQSYRSIGRSKNGGQNIEPVFEISNEILKTSDPSKYNKESIQII